MKMKRQLTACVLSVALCLSMLPASQASAAKKVSLSTKKLTVTKGKSKTLKVKNAKKKVAWKIISGKKYISLKKKGKTAVTIRGKKKGMAKVQAKIGKKKLKCTVTVKDVKKAKKTKKPVVTTAPPVETEIPMETDTPKMITPPVEMGGPAGTTASSATPNATKTPIVNNESKTKLTYQAYVQQTGWMDEVSENEIAGTTGKAKRLECLVININEKQQGEVRYRAYVSQQGWQDWKTSGNMSGTTGKSRAIEAVEISLTGEISEKYDIYYRLHVEQIGWLGWAKNGELAGSTALSIAS